MNVKRYKMAKTTKPKKPTKPIVKPMGGDDPKPDPGTTPPAP